MFGTTIRKQTYKTVLSPQTRNNTTRKCRSLQRTNDRTRTLSTTLPNRTTASPSPSSSSSSTGPTTTTARTKSSVSPSEIAHFSSLSSKWWDESGEFALLHRMNPVRVQFLRERVAWTREEAEDDPALSSSSSLRDEGVGKIRTRWLDGLKVLDVGCGGGLFSESLARLGATTTGIDASESNIKVASHHSSLDPFFSSSPSTSLPTPFHQLRLEYIHTSAEDLLSQPGRSESFDVVCAMEVLEHVEDPRSFLRTLGRLIKPGGHLILSTISRTPLAQFLTITIAENPVIGFVSPGTHTYSKYVRPEELRRYVLEEPPSVSVSGSGEVGGSVSVSMSGGVDVEGYDGMGWWDEGRRETILKVRGEREWLESRGVIYEPWRGKWRLLETSGGTTGLGGMCNYFFGARKPFAS